MSMNGSKYSLLVSCIMFVRAVFLVLKARVLMTLALILTALFSCGKRYSFKIKYSYHIVLYIY